MDTKEEVYNRCYSLVLNFISHSQRTEFEVNKKLDKVLERYASELDEVEREVIREKIKDELELQGLINDEEYASQYVNQKMHAKNPYSRLEISKFLYKKGVDREVADTALLDYTDEIERENIQKIIQKRSSKPKDKIIKYLGGRGFNSYNVHGIV